MNTENMKQDFVRDGFLIIRGFLSANELKELQARATRCMRGLRDYDGPKKFEGVRKNLNKDDPWFEEQLLHGKQTDLLRELLDDDLEPATAAWFDRVPGETSGIQPHFDAIGHRRLGATIWIALDRADQENGCLYYVKGSHKTDLPSKIGLPGFSAESEGAIAVEVEPGDAAIHGTLTVHWSGANQSERSRRAISYFYWAASSKGNPDWGLKKG